MLVTTSSLSRPRFAEANVIPFPGASRREDAAFQATGMRNRLGRELPQYTHDQMIRMSFLAYRINPLAHRLIEMQVNFVLGNGISCSSADHEALVLINEWWNDPYNKWPYRVHQRFRDLYIYGEWLHWPLVNTQTGFTFIRDLQPDSIEAVLPASDDHGVPNRIKFKNIIDVDGNTRSDIFADVIRYRIDTTSGYPVLNGPSGDVLLSGINRTSDSMRGIGELFTLLDYIDMYDDILFSRAEKIRNMSHIYYDLTLEGMTEQEMREFLQNEENLPPRPGTVYAHNPSVVLEMKAPELQADDHAKDTSVLKSHIISSAGWPGTWFDDPGTAGRAVGAEMAEPALKNIVNLQAYAEMLLRDEINYYLWQCSLAGKYNGFKNGKQPQYVLSFSRPSARDISKVGPAINRLASALDLAASKTQIITVEEARAVFVSQINQLGLGDAALEIELPAILPKKIDSPAEIAQRQLDAQRAAAANGEPGTGQPVDEKTKAKVAEKRAAAIKEALGVDELHATELPSMHKFLRLLGND